MKYILKNNDISTPLLNRLFQIRDITDNLKDFLNPTFNTYWHDPLLLNDMQKTVDFLIDAMKNNKKIMIFGDYDVDGITSSFLLYHTITKYFNYKNISVMFPDRMKDGYGLKTHHLDIIKSKDVDIVITVDNGITSVKEATYANKIGLTLIITDHHDAGKKLPKAFSIINPKISPDYPFRYLCGASVVLKLIVAILDQSNFNKKTKQKIFKSLLPNTAIATVADIVPLQDENRLIVKQGLSQMNNKQDLLPSVSGFLDFCKIKKVDTFQIGFIIGPRINAAGRIDSPLESFYAILTDGKRQIKHLENLDKFNTNRKKIQESAIKKAEADLNNENKVIIAYNEDFHEGVIGIVAGRLADKYNKPTIVLTKKENGNITGSLRGPGYFSIIDMIHYVDNMLIGSGGHKQAGGMSFEESEKDKICKKIIKYCNNKISDENLEKELFVDTILSVNERDEDILHQITILGPFGEGNPEPTFLLQDIKITGCKKIGKKGNGHIKLTTKYGRNKIEILFWRKGAQLEEFESYIGQTKNIYGKVQQDNFNGGFMVEGLGVE